MEPARCVLCRNPYRQTAFPAVTLLILFAAGVGWALAASASPVPTVTPTSAPVWSAVGEASNDDFGFSVAAAGDVNRDGYGDVIVGTPGWGGGYNYFGRALVYLGSSAGLSPKPAWTMEGVRLDGGLGYSVAGAGDVNGDGFDDVILGEYGFDGGHRPYRGRAIIVPGSPNGLRSTRAWDVAGDVDHEYLGEAVAGAGDVNGDGYDDVLVSGELRTVLLYGQRGAGGPTAGWSGPPAYRVCGAGDVNGDGYDDVLLGSVLYLGSPGGLSTSASWAGPWAPAIAGGDLNGDGYSDVVLGGAGGVHVFAGSALGPSSTPTWEIRDTGFSTRDFGSSVAAAGDVNGDGYTDLAVAAPNHDEFQVRTPSVFIYLGGPSGPSAGPDWAARKGPLPPERWVNVALGADAEGDGRSEVLIGWPDDLVNGSTPGRAELYALGPAYPAPRLVHEAVWNVPLGAAVELDALVTDATHSVAKVEILYRQIWDAEYGPSVPMTPAGGDRYLGTLTAEQIGNVGIVYIIRATDDYGLAAETIPVGLDVVYPGVAAFRVRVEADSRGGAGRISFDTRRPGPARLRVFDVQGRLVRTLLAEGSLPPGRHSISLDRLGTAAGVLFYRVETADGTRSGRLVRFK